MKNGARIYTMVLKYEVTCMLNLFISGSEGEDTSYQMQLNNKLLSESCIHYQCVWIYSMGGG